MPVLQRSFDALLLTNEAEYALLWKQHVAFQTSTSKASQCIFRLLKSKNKVFRDLGYTILKNSRDAQHYFQALLNENFLSKKAIDNQEKLAELIVAAERDKKEIEETASKENNQKKLAKLKVRLSNKKKEIAYLHEEKEGLSWIGTNLVCYSSRNEIAPHYYVTACRDAAQYVNSYFELRREWKQKTNEVKQERAKFERENPEFLAILPEFQVFYRENGQITGRRARWQKYFQWLTLNQQLAAWRGKPAVLNLDGISFEGKKLPRKKFWKQNPEIAALDQKYQDYRRICRCPSPNTYTVPHPSKHPRSLIWYNKAEPSYCDIGLGSIMLPLELPSKKKHLFKWKFDSRVVSIETKQVEETKKNGKVVKTTKCFLTTNEARIYEVNSVQLRFRKGHVYASITGKRRVDFPTLPINPTICTVDLGLRNIATIGAFQKNDTGAVYKSSCFLNNSCEHKVIKLRKILARKQSFAKARPGKRNNKVLHRHIRNILKDHARRTARFILNFAISHKSQVLVVEELGSLIGSLSNSRYFNKKLKIFVHGIIRRYLQMMATEEGIRYVEISPYGTSQICSRCGVLGRRFSIKNKKISFPSCGKLFGCPNCKNVINSDFNAICNLAKRYFDENWLANWPEEKEKRKLLKEIAQQQVLSLTKDKKLVS